MKIYEILKNDIEHKKTLKDTGFWGKMGAGCIIFSKESNKFLLQYRSSHVEQPNTYGTWGGAVDAGHSPEETVLKEVKEESGYTGNVKLHPIYLFKHSSGFQYHNFIAEIENDFKPILNWEAEGYKWCEFEKWPSPLHFGMKAILSDDKSVSVMKKLMPQKQWQMV